MKHLVARVALSVVCLFIVGVLLMLGYAGWGLGEHGSAVLFVVSALMVGGIWGYSIWSDGI